MGKAGTGKVLKKCLFCKIDFYARHDRPGRYCGRSCKSKDLPKKKTRVTLKCKECAIAYEIRKYREKTSFYCSRKCLSINRGLRMRKENHPKWKGGITERPYIVRNAIKKMINKFPFCKNCGSKKELQGHHIISYSERPELGSDNDNIEVLCKYCHAEKHPEIKNFILREK